MRTSRISRETAQLVAALSPTRPAREGVRRSLRAFGLDPVPDSDAGLGVPSVSITTSSRNGTEGRPGKRKREETETLVKVEIEDGSDAALLAAATRRSPRKAPKIENDENDDGGDDGGDDEPKRKPRRRPAKHIKGANGQVTVEPPVDWERVYETTTTMRKRLVAPVDTMGCESLAETGRPPREQRLQTLVSLMLSSQTKDTVTAAAMRRLQEGVPGGLTLAGLLAIDPPALDALICKVGFHNNKTRFIKATAEILRDRHNGDIPDTIEGLIALPGVGPKMAYLCMSAAWGRDEGIGVDVHVHRITNLWGWHKTSTPEQTRAELEAWLPRDKWHDINHLLVGLGQTVCLPIGRRCGECDLARDKLCPSAVAGSPVKRRVKREIDVKVDDGNVVRDEKVKVELDDAGIKVEAELADEGHVEMHAVAESAMDR